MTSNPYLKGALPLPRPPLQVKDTNVPEEKNKNQLPKSLSVEENLAALSAYRMARGLCKKCWEKWSQGHQCAATV
jgi:hypothetical protein